MYSAIASFPFRLAVVLFLINLRLPLDAQTPATKIDLVVVRGEGATNTGGQKASVIPIVQVVNENQQPLAGAVVVFNLPISGTSGEFEKGTKNLTVTTDQNGMASGNGLTVNRIPGRLQILVTARYRGVGGRVLINQTVQGTEATAGHSGGGHKWIAILVVIGGAAAGGAVALTRKGSSANGAPSMPAPIGITPGTVSITHP